MQRKYNGLLISPAQITYIPTGEPPINVVQIVRACARLPVQGHSTCLACLARALQGCQALTGHRKLAASHLA